MSLDLITTVKLLLELEDNEKDSLLLGIIDIQTKALLAKINMDSLPIQLEFIVIETSIVRYNRLGSEGLKSEGIDVISQTFVEDIFTPYQADISAYKASLSVDMDKPRLRMI